MTCRRLECHRPSAITTFIVLLLCGFLGTSVGVAQADTMNGLYLQAVPSLYADQERIISSLHDTGANTVIVELPLTQQGLPDMGKVPNLVYLVHKAGFKMAVILPVRRLPGVIELHPGWEDVRYDPARDSTSRAGMLDLFRPEVVLYLVDLVKKLAFYSVDGILLGQDFAYGPGDGMSDLALARAREKIGEPVRTKKMFLRGSRGPAGAPAEEYGDLFWKWAEFKRDRLLQVYDTLAAAARSVKAETKFGIPAPVVLPVPVAREVLAQYAYDMGAFRQRSVDYYWSRFSTSGDKEQGNLAYSQAMELVSRMATSTATIIKEPEKRVIVLDAVSAGGGLLPLSEIEEVSELVRNTGPCGISYAIMRNTVLPKSFMQKMFGQRN